jgi:hypothetical protein
VDDDNATLQRLRHAAFSRDATHEDLRRLAEVEARLAVAERAAMSPLEEAQDVDEPPEVEEVEVNLAEELRRPLSRRRLALTIGAAAVGGVMVGALVGALLTTTAAPDADAGGNWSGASSLAVFDRDPTPLDDPGNRLIVIAELLAAAEEEPSPGARDIEVRWIGAPGGFTTYAARASGLGPSIVCVVVSSALEEISSCVPEDDFEVDGIRIMAFGLDLRWGPTGAEVWANSSG